MLIKELKKFLKENYEDGIKRQLRDALIQLRIGGQEQLSTLSVLQDFKNRGMQISIEELISLLQDDPMIQDVNREKIVFKSETVDPNTDTENKQVTDEENRSTISSMAKKAAGRRLRTGE